MEKLFQELKIFFQGSKYFVVATTALHKRW